MTLVSGAVRRAHPSRTRCGPRLAPRFCRWLACVLSPPLSLSSLRHRAPVWLARSPATPAKWSAPPPSSSCHSPITVTACHLPFPPDSRLGPIPPPTRHHCPGARATPHTSGPGLACPALTFTSEGLPPAPQTHPDPTPTPTSRRSIPASHMRLAGLCHLAHAPAERLLERPADLSARFPRAPPIPSCWPSRKTPPKHPWACLPASRLAAAPSPCDRSAQVPDPRGAPTSHGPKHLRPILSPTHADAHGPGRGLKETSFGHGKHTSGHGGSFPTGDSAPSHPSVPPSPHFGALGRPATSPPKDTVLERTWNETLWGKTTSRLAQGETVLGDSPRGEFLGEDNDGLARGMEWILDSQLDENGKLVDVITRGGVRGTGRCACACVCVWVCGCVCGGGWVGVGVGAPQCPPLVTSGGGRPGEILPQSGRIESCGQARETP